MNPTDRFDDQITEHLRTEAPREAPAQLLDATMSRIADTPQRSSGGWLGRPATRLLAAAAVLLLAVVAGTQLAGLLGRPTGDVPSLSPSVAPSGSPAASPSASSAAPSSSATTVPSASAVADDDLVLRIELAGGGPTYPTQYLPWVTLMGDGTLIWQPVPPETEAGSLLTRQLTEQGLAELREQIFGSGLLDVSATHELEPLPDSEPPGRGVGVFFFTANGGGGQAVVRSVQWLGDEEEATYYQPSPERQELDALAQRMRDPEALLGADAWAGPAEPYEGTDYRLWLTPYRDVPPFDTADASEIPWPFDEPLDEFGEPSGSSPPVTRCGAITREEAAAIIDALASLGYAQIGLDRATAGSLDWAEGNGTVDVAILPLMPDGYPDCQPQQP